jgi:hypothetical protein
LGQGGWELEGNNKLCLPFERFSGSSSTLFFIIYFANVHVIYLLCYHRTVSAEWEHGKGQAGADLIG